MYRHALLDSDYLPMWFISCTFNYKLYIYCFHIHKLSNDKHDVNSPSKKAWIKFFILLVQYKYIVYQMHVSKLDISISHSTLRCTMNPNRVNYLIHKHLYTHPHTHTHTHTQIRANNTKKNKVWNIYSAAFDIFSQYLCVCVCTRAYTY